MVFPASTLTPITICGFVTDACGDPLIGTVKVTRLSTGTDPVCDPSNGALVSATMPIVTFDDGCWSTCPLLPNSAADSNAALTPNTTSYQIVVVAGSQEIVNQIVHLNVESVAQLPTTTADGNTCINIKEFLALPPGGNPPPETFCTSVVACLPPETVTSLSFTGTVLTYRDETGATTTIDLATLQPDCDPAAVAATVPA